MGIGNDTADAVIESSLELITPHGDRKLPLLLPLQVESLAHYPSWGSETSKSFNPEVGSEIAALKAAAA